jgi:putative NADH-flavin reductase
MLFSLVFIALVAAVRSKKVCIIGANGRTGRLLVDLAAEQGYSIDAYTRTGELTTPMSALLAKRVVSKRGDVTQPDTLIGVDSNKLSSRRYICTQLIDLVLR